RRGRRGSGPEGRPRRLASRPRPPPQRDARRAHRRGGEPCSPIHGRPGSARPQRPGPHRRPRRRRPPCRPARASPPARGHPPRRHRPPGGDRVRRAERDPRGHRCWSGPTDSRSGAHPGWRARHPPGVGAGHVPRRSAMSTISDSDLRSPLEEIEQLVQSRANALALDVDTADGRSRLRELISNAVEDWADDHARGVRPHGLPDPQGVVDRAFRNLARYGPLTDLLADPDVWEIMVNAPDQIFVKRHSGGNRFHHEVFHDDDHVTRTLTKLLDDSATSHRKLDPAEGLQDAQLDDGARLHIVHSDLSRGGHLMVNIRKFTGVAITRLNELVERGSMTRGAARFLAEAVRARLSIVFAGAPGAGKTTLLSCCAAELDPSLRVVIAEEVFEADVELANVAGMETR